MAAPAPPQVGHRHRHLPAPGATAAAPQDAPILQDPNRAPTRLCGCYWGRQDMVPPPPASLGHPAGKAKGKLRHDSPLGHSLQDTLQPCPRLCPQCQGSGGHRRPPQPVPTRPEWPQSQRGGVAPPADTQSLNWSHWVPPPPGRLRRGTAPRAGPARTCTSPRGQGRAGGAPPHPDPRGSPRQRAPQGTHVVGNRHGHPLPWGWGEKRSSSHPMASKRASRETEAL